MHSLRETAISRLAAAGIRKEMAIVATDIVMEVFAERPNNNIDGRYLRNGSLILDKVLKSVMFNGEPIMLPLSQFRLLEYFMKHVGIVVSTQQIMKALWANDDNGHCLRVILCGLRKRLKHPDLIINKSRYGYYMQSLAKENA